MVELEKLIAECEELKRFHVNQRNNGVRGAGVEALAVSIRLKALNEARDAILKEYKFTVLGIGVKPNFITLTAVK